jgi:hypothetical protein
MPLASATKATPLHLSFTLFPFAHIAISYPSVQVPSPPRWRHRCPWHRDPFGIAAAVVFLAPLVGDSGIQEVTSAGPGLAVMSRCCTSRLIAGVGHVLLKRTALPMRNGVVVTLFCSHE